MKKIIICMLVSLVLMACGNGNLTGKTGVEAEGLIDAAYRAKDYKRLLVLADSLHQQGELSDGDAYYWQGYASDRLMQRRTAEFYWKSAMDAVENSTDAADLSIYAKSASRLTNELSLRGDYESALKIAEPAAARLESLGCDTTSDYTNLLIFVGCCQSRFGQPAEKVNASLGRAYSMHMDNIKKTGSGEAYKNAIAGFTNIAYNCIGIKKYNDALQWIDRLGKLVTQYEQRQGFRDDYVDRQWARYDIYRAIALEGLGRYTEASEVYQDYSKTAFAHTPEGRIEGADYLTAAGRWEEAADCYLSLDEQKTYKQDDLSLENIQNLVLKKYKVNVKAGRAETANAVARRVCESLDSAITQSRRLDLAEQEIIREKEAQILERHNGLVRQRMVAAVAVLILMLLSFVAYSLYRRRSTHRLSKAHKELKAAYSQLEENTVKKTTNENEQRWACDMRTKTLPVSLPNSADMNLYALLTPGKEMGGNFYDFFVRDGMLFFCIGDVAGKGVAAAHAMSVAQAHFRSASAFESQPNRILADINKNMAADAGQMMTLSLFVGVLDLSTGRLRYANAGHCAPLLVGSGIGLLPVDSNAPAGQDADGQYTVQETLLDPGTVIFLYTKGLLEAEGADQEQFGEKRMCREALQAIHGLDPSPQPFIERMVAAVKRFSGDTEQKNEMTMLAIRYMKKTKDVKYQRSISLPNDESGLSYLSHFVDEVGAALRFDKDTISDMNQALKDVVVNVINNTSPEGTKGNTRVEARADNQCLTFVVRNDGAAIDPAAVKEMESADLKSVYQCMDAVSIERKEDQNVLTLTKKLS